MRIFADSVKCWDRLVDANRRPQIKSLHLSTKNFNSKTLPALNYIHGRRILPKCSENFEVREPANGQLLGKIHCSGEDHVNEAVKSSVSAFTKWSALSGSQRASVLHKAASIVRKRQSEIAKWESSDTGRHIRETLADVASGAQTLEYYASLATTSVDQHIKLQNGSFAYVTKEPYGVVGAIGSWNFPFLGATWKVAPGLACGNTMVYKPSPLAPITTPILAEILNEAGTPPGSLNVVQGEAATGSLLCKHEDISKVSFTGGVDTGKKILESCASGIKQVTLELGGKSPLIIFPDCDMANAVNATLNGNFELSGQSCTNGTRVFVHDSIKGDFVKKIAERTRNIKVGDPFDHTVQMGPLISEDHMRKVLEYVESARREGAQVLCGGEHLQMADPKLAGGYYMSPCVLTNCHDDMKAMKEEIFGPVMAILTFLTEEEVIRRANDTHYGLASGVFTRDLARAHRCATKLNAGACWVNNYNIFHPEFPVGGYKMSGIGRENGHEALAAYTQTKVVYVENGNVETPY